MTVNFVFIVKSKMMSLSISPLNILLC